MSNLRLKLQVLCFALMMSVLAASAQSAIRYVDYAKMDNTGDGSSWATAKKDIQEAINDLVNNNLTGEVWVKGSNDAAHPAVYYPTETTESSGSEYYKSFKIPAGITVRGGFKGDEENASERVTIDDKNFGAGVAKDGEASGNLDGEEAKSGVYEYKTILCGDLRPSKVATLVWNKSKQQFNTTFYGNSYHVVWFAMNGFNSEGRANPLTKPAKLEGCVVKGGHAYTSDAIKTHPHESYGGGIYMVANSFVYNCEVKDCDAARNGGGIYMDGGGIVRRTLVHNCQALGLGTDYGFGGGICEDGYKTNSKSNPIVVAQSVVTNCVGRMGGGMALLADQTIGKNKYVVVANSTLVNNNTATIEAGGVYTYKGGGLASMTVVRNKCNGSGITQNGQITGRSGGVYSRDASYIGNTVIWGNECEANKDIQYADSRSSLSDTEKTKFYYSALSNADIADWSKSEKMGVLSLDNENTEENVAQKGNKGYPLFENPTDTAGYSYKYYERSYAESFDWKVYSESALHHAGINTADLDHEGLTPAPQGESCDMQFGVFNSRCTMGAIVSEEPRIDSDNDLVAGEAHFFVDPSYNFAHHHDDKAKGMSWTTPTRFLGNVLEYINADRKKAVGEQEYADKAIFIHVKEGTVDNTDSYKSGRVRTTSLDIPSNVTILGSYDKSLTEKDLSKRNPVSTPTIISGKLLNDYKYNIAHLINIDNDENVTIDGFKITLANANSTELGNTNQNGAAITIKGSTVGIHFKNIIVSNCFGDKGTVIYADASTADFENCIFHNNTTATLVNSGLIYGINGSNLSFDHCNVLRSVGHASYLSANTTNEWKNSMFYGNLDRQQDNTNNSDAYSILAFEGPGTITGERNMFDRKSYAAYNASLGGGIPASSTYNLPITYTNGEVSSDLIGKSVNYGLNYVYKSGTANGYPRMVNPTKNAGYSTEGDITYYGRATSFEPHNDNPVVNAASFTDAHDTWGVDIVGTRRDFGGLPDIGAVESYIAEITDGSENANHDGQMPYGAVIYVRDYNATGTNVQTYDRVVTVNHVGGHSADSTNPEDHKNDTETVTYEPNAEGKGLYIKNGENYYYLSGNSWHYAINGNADYAGSATQEGKTTWYAKGTGTVDVFKGFKIKSGTRYLSLNGSNLTTVTNVDQATVWTVGSVSTAGGITAGNYSIGANGRYITITRSGQTRTLTTSTNPGDKLTFDGSENNFTLAANSRYVRLSNTTLSASTTSTTWTFEGVTETEVTGYVETVYEQNAVRDADKTVAAGVKFTDPVKLHVYHSKEDIDNLGAGNLKTIKLGSGGSGTNYAGRTTTDGTLHSTAVGSADEFVLISTGTDDRYFIYDVSAGQYVYYTATSQSGANQGIVKLTDDIAGKNATWWVVESNSKLYIKPGTLAINADMSWNYYGGSGNQLGLAAMQWGDSQWQATPVVGYDVYKTETQVPTNVIGLQYAVNNAFNAMQRVSVKEEKIVTEKYGNSEKSVKHTYYHFTPSDDQPEISVYVGAGVYTQDRSIGVDGNEAGFLIRNHVKVYGAFPATGTPGMNERHAQLSAGIKGARAEDVQKYETILQTNKTTPESPYTDCKVANVLSQPRECQVTEADNDNTPQDRVVYEGCLWDGFTMRNGYFHGVSGGTGRRWGGPGVALYENVTLRNCVVRDNLLSDTGGSGSAGRGAGIYCDGSTIENCYLLDNESACTTENFGGGIYMIQGTMFNTVIAGNKITASTADHNHGAGIFIESAKFYNNTIVNNTGGSAIGVYTASKASADLTVYNTIAVAGTGEDILWRADGNTPTVFVNCYLKTDKNTGDAAILAAMGSSNPTAHSDAKGGYDYEILALKGGVNDYLKVNRKRENRVFMVPAATVAENSGISYATISSLGDENPFVLSYAQAVEKYDYRIVAKSSGSGTLAANNCVNTGTEIFNESSNGQMIELPDYDMDWDDRIQDCTIDIGAYECNGSAGIAPATDVAYVPEVKAGQAIYYVTPDGYGTSAGNDPENAACAAKLQRVLDAAGRYKYQHPGVQVIVKVANSYNLAAADSYFQYYATRTSDLNSTDTRMWSIQIPRGVEVWGGYTDVPVDAAGVKTGEKETWTNENNGFYNVATEADVAAENADAVGDIIDHRNITKFPTYFDSYFYNKDMKINATTYHVVTFSDRVYDVNGTPYIYDPDNHIDDRSKVATGALSSWSQGVAYTENQYLHMSQVVSGNVMAGTVDGKVVSNRAVLDGIFVTGGKADGKALSGSSNLNANGYGGAAIVTDYAYVRNCILIGNYATNGGALALTDRAFVSGSLIVENNADNMGGGLYVFENGVTLSNGIKVNSSAPAGENMDYNMAHVFTSTIVNNKAQQGGGIWFTEDLNPNARFNSVAVWQNQAQDQDNVYGMINPEQPTDDETLSEVFYPFAFSLIQNMRASGSNNLDAMGLNRQGVRFVNKDSDVGKTPVDQYDLAVENENVGENEYINFGYYGLTKYSTLCSNGMPKTMYDRLIERIAISDVDFLGQPRKNEINTFIEIGARALPKLMPNRVLMLRLFVAHPEAVDTKTANQFMRLNELESLSPEQKYYSQMGSSFAYPFNFLQDAIDYIKRARNGQIDGLKLSNGDAATSDIVRNLPFEIVLGRGTYYPKQGLNGQTESVWAQTFAIPEGVTIIGGFNPEGGVAVNDPTYYGRYYQAKKENDEYLASSTAEGDIYKNVETIPSQTATPADTEVGRGNKFGTENVSLPMVGTPAHGVKGDPDYTPASSDYMPARTVKFQQWNIQDIADRRAMADNNGNGIIEPWEFANQTIISGNAVNGETDGVYHIMTAVADADAVGLMPKVQSSNDDWTDNNFQVKEEGQQIRLNGLIVTGGNALTYLATALDSYGANIYYQGAGLQVDGNRYNTTLGGTPTFYNPQAYGVGYRDIPISITNCQFRNNIAGYGGAISSNGSLSLFASSFEQNMALAQTETSENGNFKKQDGTDAGISKVMYPGQGGAILATHQLSAFNTLFANNEARLADGEEPNIDVVLHPSFRVPHPTAGVLRAAGGAIMMGFAGKHHIVNCDFVRNKANMYPAVFTLNPTVDQNPDYDTNPTKVVDTHDYSQIINTVAWQNEVDPDFYNLFKNSNAEYAFASKLFVNVGKKNRTTQYVPGFGDGKSPASQEDLDGTAGNWQEAVWFSAYEKGTGFTPNNENDLRDAIIYSPLRYAVDMIRDANVVVVDGVTTHPYQNCNLEIVEKNDDVAGPNFGNPSVKSGFEGFMEGADWSPSRFNRLTDNGNGWIRQDVTIDNEKKDYVVTFHNDEGPTSVVDEQTVRNYQGAYTITHYISDLTVDKKFPEYKLWLALGNEKYMQATNDSVVGLTINGTPIGTVQKNYPRISPDPTIGLTKAYIDIGVYEYQKQPLLKPGNEVDILWVSTKERPENGVADGSTWSKPTSDLQRAINTLLQSRNGHKKEIRIMEGEYAPVTPQTIEGVSGKVNAFVIDTKSLNASAIVPSAWLTDHKKDKYFAQSLTIKGGYSSEIMYEYDPVKYKTVIRQKEAADGSNDNHLIYVADPTVRYYYDTAQGYTDNNDGATWSTSSSDESHTVRTMPIQIDGVTLINNMAEAGIAGSAIYYPEQATTMTQAHSVSVDAELTYYTDASHETKSGHDGKDETDFPLIEGGKTMNDPAKIVITKTQVVGSGKPTTLTEHDDPATASAVYIGKYGGHALIYNTVFHSNFGMPLNAYNTVNVNNTFGLNAGKVQLNDVALASGSTPYVTSEMHNSALWKNNETSTKGQYGAQVYFGDAVAAGSAKFTYNSYTGATADATNHLTSLDDLNSNIGEGPNFVDPENADIESRNFDIKPSMRLLNQGNNVADAGLYYDKILHYDLGYKVDAVEQYANYDYALSATTDVDVMNRPRFKSVIDLGAYEFQGSLYDVLYVDPNKSHSNDATGENWDSAFGYGDLQNAVDLAAIYHATTPSKEAYVFVKGNSSTNKELNTNETLIIRDGVTAYGSIISSYNEWHGDTKHAGNVSEYIKDMTSIREGVASEAASKTIVTGIKVDDNASYNGGTSGQFPALVDGFLVTNPNTSSTPVVDITSTSKDAVIVVRNVVVADNNVTGGADVAKISNGLIYEALFRDNATTGAVLRVSNVTVPAVSPAVEYTTNGYAVNVTVEGKTVGADNSMPVDGNAGAAAEKKAQIYNSITNSITVPAASASGAYGSIKNQHISGYFYNIADPNLNYQLTETSKYIDMCDQTVNPMTTAGATNLVQFINYDTDRDILGNPRVLAGVTDGKTVSTKTYLLDRGAFETWKVKNTKNVFFCGENGTISTIEPYKANSANKYSFIKKHFYPHDGSVCYIMEGQTLVIDPFDPTHEVKATPHNPGFMLVQKGANFYGNGRPATCAYLAIERDVKQGGSIVSIPYAMKYNENVSKPMYDSNGYLVQLDNNVVSAASEYNGLKRSDWKYIFQKTETSCWTPIGNTAVTAANRGVLLEAKSNNFSSEPPVVDKVTLRFTGQGANMTDYIYTEDGVSKNVTLTKYDDVESTNNGADYTDELDMGWNCFGLPYLVSSYKPYKKVSIGSEPDDVKKNKVVENPSGEYSMNIPHTLWLYYDGTQAPDGTKVKPTMGDGGYYNVKAWESTNAAWHVNDATQASIWLGEGIFTQTATNDDTENLKFWLPIAPAMKADGGANAKAAAMSRFFVDATAVEETETADDVKLVATEYYTADGVRINKTPRRGTVVIIRKVFSNGAVKTSKQFMK